MHHVTDFRIYHTTLTVNLTLWDTVVNCQRYKVDSKVNLLGLFHALLKLSDWLLLF